MGPLGSETRPYCVLIVTTPAEQLRCQWQRLRERWDPMNAGKFEAEAWAEGVMDLQRADEGLAPTVDGLNWELFGHGPCHPSSVHDYEDSAYGTDRNQHRHYAAPSNSDLKSG